MKLLNLACIAQAYVIFNQQQPSLQQLEVAKDEVFDVADSELVKEQTLLDLIYEHKDLKLASKLIKERPTIENALKSKSSELTVFVPTDDALEHVKHFPFDETTQLLLYHVVDKVYEAEELKQGMLLESGLSLVTLGDKGQKIKITTEHGIIQLNYHSHVFESNLKASNGIVHTIDKLLIPPPNLFRMVVHDFRYFGGFGLALKITGLSHLVKQSHSATVFAPTNKAFKKLGPRKYLC